MIRTLTDGELGWLREQRRLAIDAGRRADDAMREFDRLNADFKERAALNGWSRQDNPTVYNEVKSNDLDIRDAYEDTVFWQDVANRRAALIQMFVAVAEVEGQAQSW